MMSLMRSNCNSNQSHCPRLRDMHRLWQSNVSNMIPYSYSTGTEEEYFIRQSILAYHVLAVPLMLLQKFSELATNLFNVL